jgi:hypothetical protein
MFKIRDRETGLFSSGGMSPRWRVEGKVWKKKQHVSSHFNHVDINFYEDADVVEFEMREVSVKSALDWTSQQRERAKVREAREQKWRAAQELEYAQREVERAQARLAQLKKTQ